MKNDTQIAFTELSF